MNDYNKKIISLLFLAIITLLLILVFARSGVIDFIWTTLLLSLAVSLLSSFLFFVVFRGFDNEKKENEIDSIVKTIGLNRKLPNDFWIDFIKDLSKTKDDVIFYGYNLGHWLNYPFHELLRDKLKAKHESTKLYFILHDKGYYEDWKSFFETNQIDATLILVPPDIDKLAYSIACCGDKILIVLRTGAERDEDRLTLVIKSQSYIGKIYIDYLNKFRLKCQS